ncbi:hypothetical protein KPH14_012962 [Odynerus spinipes]|uniref:Endonuclease/exonuclease/phosphatase domain-containing protein n=1 Tax=Odynerus spinipes TaxID=1348599 RepID=A0AAD9R855_9HYME|nr:hypothetical protein KPH14_012962 [Odynerus spinipes]
MAVKIAQINAQRSATAAAELLQIAEKEKIDILCVQEPYVFKGLARGYPGVRVVQPQVNYPWVAIVVMNSEIETFQILYEETEHVMCVQVKIGASVFYIINVYCQYSKPIEPFLTKIEKILIRIPSAKIIITTDANASAKSWFSDSTCQRGILLEEFIASNNLYVVNKLCNVKTFSNVTGSSNIDITIATGGIFKKIVCWNVQETCVSSDHNLISFYYSETGNTRTAKIDGECKYNINKADWMVFRERLNEAFNNERLETLGNENIDRIVQTVSKKIDEVCGESMPRCKKFEKKVPWWNDRISNLRKAAYRIKKELSRGKRLNLVCEIDGLAAKYRAARNRYTAEVRRSKKSSWKEFVTNTGNAEPWGPIYRLAKDKILMSGITSSIYNENKELTLDWEETMHELLRVMVPKDDKDAEMEMHRSIKSENGVYINYNLEPDITWEEVNKALCRSKNKKAPGLDGIRIEKLENYGFKNNSKR